VKKDGDTESKAKGKSSPKEGRRQTRKLTTKACATGSMDIAVKVERLFEAIDADQSGLIDASEFASGLMLLPGITELKTANGERLKAEHLKRLALVVDPSGRISILALLEAFTFEDKCGEALGDTLAEHILAVLFRNRQTVRAGCRYFDSDSSGKVSEQEFESVLTALNRELKETGQHFSNAQIRDLCEGISTMPEAEPGCVPDAVVQYIDFFGAIEVIDSENAATGVRIASGSPRSANGSPRDDKTPRLRGL